MNTNEEFDELARRKLEERSFAFQESDWEQARQLIDHSRGRKPWTNWVAGAGMAVVVAGLLWLGTRDDQTADPVAERAPAAATVHSTATTAQAMPTDHNADQPQRGPDAHAPEIAAAVIAGDSMLAPGTSLPATTQHTELRPEDAAVRTTVVRPAPLKTAAPQAVRTVEHAAPQDGPTVATAGVHNIVHARATVETPGVVAIPPTNIPEPDVNTGGRSASADVAGSAVAEGTQKQLLPGLYSTTTGAAPEPLPNMATQASARGSVPAWMRVIGPDAATLPLASPLVAAAPVVPYHAPWEVSLLAGGFASTNHYSGGNSAEWAGGVSGANSLGLGAELVHMGRNLGLGFGLHYGTYAERLRLDPLDATTLNYHPFWYLMAVDTSVLVITDTLPGTPPTYNGQHMDTTFYVLAQGTDTVVGHERLRDAHDRINRLSYLEVPLLADVHLVQGRWVLGLRGGPTIGLLTGRRGSLPTAADGGMVAYTEQPFSELMFGYTARAYVRYRFSAGWSIGLEPALRGQLFNGLDSGALERKSAAKGVVMSLSYRIR